jgi:RNA polymerase sigma-70 factor, ECF subfamily
MPEFDPSSVTRMLNDANHGSREAADQVLRIVQDELHKLAALYMRHEREDHTLQPTALMNEAYLKIFGGERLEFNDRAHFFVIAARQMRRILVDHARKVQAEKRGAGGVKVELADIHGSFNQAGEDLVAVDEALEALAKVDERAARVVELKFFGGLSDKEVSGALGVPFTTVRRDWEFARAYLFKQLRRAQA